MKEMHVSEKAIQDYAMDQFVTEDEKAHIASCDQCLAELNQYQLLFSQIELEPSASFDFDLASLVNARLPRTNSRLSADDFIGGFLILFIIAFIGIPVVLFRQYILNMFSGISPVFIFCVVCSAIIILVFTCLNMYRKYRKQMQILNFH